MGAKHRYSIVAALLAALLVALLSGGALAEDRIELGVDGLEVAIEEIPAGDDLELDFGEDMAQDDLSLELPKDGLALDDALILSEALLTDDNPVKPEQNAIAPNEGEDIPSTRPTSLTRIYEALLECTIQQETACCPSKSARE